MKKTLFTIAATFLAAATISCADNGKLITKGNPNKMDSLSYAYGVSLAQELTRDGGIAKELELNINTVISSMEECALNGQVIVAGDTIGENSMQRIYNKVLGRKRQMEIQAAKSDSTGNTKLYENEELRELTSAFVGCDIGLGLTRFNQPFETLWITKGAQESINSTASMTTQGANNYIQDYFTNRIPAQNKKASEEWLAKVEKQSGVKKTASGLLYKINKAGDMNAKPTSLQDVVKVHYKGTTRTGKEFDSSYKRNSPIDFPLNGVIAGWGEGLQLVGKGGSITLWIPADLAYGRRGAGSDIGPNEALRFDVELIDVTPAAQ